MNWNSLKRVHAFQIELESGIVVFFLRRGEVPEYPKKNLSEEGREPNNKLNPDMACTVQQDSNRATLVGGECCHHRVTFAPHERHLIVTT